MPHPYSLVQSSIGAAILQLAAPILCTNILQSLNGSVSFMWVGRGLGEEALAAISNVQSMMTLLASTSLGISMAAAILVGQFMGADNIVDAKRVLGTSVTALGAGSTLVALSGLVLSKPLLLLLQVPVSSLPLAEEYMLVKFCALPSLYMYTLVSSVLLSTGDCKTPLLLAVVSVAMSMILQPLFIFGVGPIPGMGLAGSALATLVGQTISLTALVIILYARPFPLALRRGDLMMLWPDRALVGELAGKGMAMSAHVIVVSLSGTLMMVLVNRFGVDTSAAYGASIQLWMYIQMPAFSIGTAVATIAALSVGAQQWGKIESLTRVGSSCNVVLTGSIVIIILALDSHIYELFLPEGSRALPIASHINRVASWSFVFLGVSIVIFAVIRATGAVMVPLLVYALALLVVRYALATALLQQWQEDAIWWSFPISSALVVVLAMLYYKYGRWRTRRQWTRWMSN